MWYVNRLVVGLVWLDMSSSVECPISPSVVVALVLMDGVAHVRAVLSDLPAM
jgi:hypothetical protein